LWITRYSVQLAEIIGRLKASGETPQIPECVQELLTKFQQSSTGIKDIDLRTIPKPPKAHLPITSDGISAGPPRITPFTMEVSRMKGDHWDGIIPKMLAPVNVFNIHHY